VDAWIRFPKRPSPPMPMAQSIPKKSRAKKKRPQSYDPDDDFIDPPDRRGRRNLENESVNQQLGKRDPPSEMSLSLNPDLGPS
jgi:hypothetical protein